MPIPCPPLSPWPAITLTEPAALVSYPVSGGGAGGAGACGGWAGIETNQCIKVTLLSAGGKCSCISLSQGPFYLVYDSDSGCWVGDVNFDTCCASSGEVGPAGVLRFCLDSELRPTLAIMGTFMGCDGVSVTDPMLALDGCTCSPTTATFRGGGSHFCNSTHVTDPCDNTFVVKVEVLACCPDPAWTGPGWYCVDIGNGCGSGVDKGCIHYIEAPCRGSVTICSGPYASQALCEAACPPSVSPSPVTSTCCPDISIPGVLYATVTGTGNCACLSGVWKLVWNGTDGWVGTRSISGVGCDGTGAMFPVSQRLKLSCLGPSTPPLPSDGQFQLHDPDGQCFSGVWAPVSPTCTLPFTLNYGDAPTESSCCTSGIGSRVSATVME